MPRGGRPLPLNSRRMTAVHLQRLARRLGLPTSASTEETRQIIDGKLSEMGREPRNVQVVIAEPEVGGAECLWLQDETGVFLRAELDSEPDSGDREEHREPDQRHGDGESPVTLESLQRALEEAEEQQYRLTSQLESKGEELGVIQEALEQEKLRVASLLTEREETAREVSEMKESEKRERKSERDMASKLRATGGI